MSTSSSSRGGCRFAQILCAVLVWSSGRTWTAAAEPRVVAEQTREFRISVDGRPRGTQTTTISRRSDGSEVMRGEAEVLINLVVYQYRYFSTGTETWKGGRLIRVSNEANYNGDKFVVEGSAVEQALHYEVNGESQKAPPDIWAASYWREPAPAKVGRKLALLDADKGRQLTGTLQRIGAETVTVAEKPVPVTHYQIRGDVEVDIWYDREGHIVRQESLESGHKTLLELMKIRRQ